MAVYILSVIIAQRGYYNPVMMDGTQLELYLKPCWVWQMSAAVITLAWINLLVYMRQVPLFGRYIIILNDIIYTFLQFVVIFIIFIISFTFGFRVLLYANVGEYDTFKDGFLKTMIMMAGEFDYGNLFYGEDGDTTPAYPGLLYAFFVLFFVLLALLLLNLLVGLSVSDVSTFVEVADLKKMSMRLKFVLNMERFLNSWVINSIRKAFPRILKLFRSKKLGTKIKKKDVNVDDHRSKMWKQIITKDLKEDKEKDMEELKMKARGIEEKLKEMEKAAENDHIKRREELQTTIEKFKSSLEEKLRKEEEDRSAEVGRTITFMNNLGL